MKAMKAGVTKAGNGIDNLVWNILGQTYVPKHLTESSFSWHALLPPGTFVPPHIHANQDEFIYVLEGKFDLILDGKDATATAGDFIRLPMKIMHGLFNKSARPTPRGPGSAQSRRATAAAGMMGGGAAAPIHLLLRKSGELGVAFDDGFALGVGEHVVDVVEAVWGAALDLVDHALGPTLAVVAHDLGRLRQPVRLVGRQRVTRMLAARQQIRQAARVEARLAG